MTAPATATTCDTATLDRQPEWMPWPEEDALLGRLRQALRAALAQDAAAAWTDLAGIGAWDFAVPLEAGGMDLGHTAVCMVCEEAGASLLPLPAVDTAVAALLAASCEATSLTARIRDGEAVVVPGRLPAAGAQATAPLLTARPALAGQHLDGVLGPVAAGIEPGMVLLLAETGSGTGLWAVPAAAAGLRVERLPGPGRDATARVVADGVHVDRHSALLGGPGGTQRLADAGCAAAVYQAALLSGVTAAALTALVARVRQRRQFGKPLSEHQAPRLRTAALLARLDVLRLAVADAAAALDAGGLAPQRAAGVAALAAETALEATRAGLHLHGASGLAASSTAARCYRRAAWEALRCGPLAALWRITSG